VIRISSTIRRARPTADRHRCVAGGSADRSRGVARLRRRRLQGQRSDHVAAGGAPTHVSRGWVTKFEWAAPFCAQSLLTAPGAPSSASFKTEDAALELGVDTLPMRWASLRLQRGEEMQRATSPMANAHRSIALSAYVRVRGRLDPRALPQPHARTLRPGA